MHKQINEISSDDTGKQFFIIAQIKSIRQTSGPTIFELKDNTGVIRATGFVKAGERAFPSIIIGDNIQATVMVKIRNNKIELEIIKYSKVSQDIITPVDLKNKKFLIESENLEKIRPVLIKTADIIKNAISENRAIVIRHHNDTDGYVSGLVVEKAIRSLISEDKQLVRLSSRTPYYDYIDALKDLNNCLGKKHFKLPLMILCDLGSNNQSIKSIKRLALYGIDFIIVDHHKCDKENQELAKSFLNPHIFGLDSNLNSGILATELALFINPSLDNVIHLPALSAIADRSSGMDVEKYVKISGFNKDYLRKWSQVIDHEAFYMKFSVGREILEDIFFPGKNCSEILNILFPEIENELGEVENSVRKYVQINEYKKFKLLRINKAEIGSFGDYASSKLIGITHNLFNGPRITIAETKDSVSFRADGVKFSVITLLNELLKKLPYALIEGGGHEHAGNIRFNAISKNEIMVLIVKFLEKNQ